MFHRLIQLAIISKFFWSNLFKQRNFELFQVVWYIESVREKLKFSKKLLKLGKLDYCNFFHKLNRIEKIFTFSKQTFQAMKLWVISSYFKEKIGIAKILKISKHPIQAMKFWIISGYFIDWIGSQKSSSFSKQANKAMKLWIILSYFIHWIGSQKPLCFLKQFMKFWNNSSYFVDRIDRKNFSFSKQSIQALKLWINLSYFIYWIS